jgi:hypothetical protein
MHISRRRNPRNIRPTSNNRFPRVLISSRAFPVQDSRVSEEFRASAHAGDDIDAVVLGRDKVGCPCPVGQDAAGDQEEIDGRGVDDTVGGDDGEADAVRGVRVFGGHDAGVVGDGGEGHVVVFVGHLGIGFVSVLVLFFGFGGKEETLRRSSLFVGNRLGRRRRGE